MSLVIETTALAGCVFGGGILAQIAGGESEYVRWLIQFGALGLCVLMVWQNDKSRRESNQTNEKQRTELLNVMTQQQNTLDVRHNEAVKLATESREHIEKLLVETVEVIRKCKNNNQ